MAISDYLGKYELGFVKIDSFVSSMFWHISIRLKSHAMRPLRRSRTENSCRGSPQKELTVQGLSDYESNIEMGTVASGGAGTLMSTREQGKPVLSGQLGRCSHRPSLRPGSLLEWCASTGARFAESPQCLYQGLLVILTVFVHEHSC
jgi:hypothetical protein